MTSFHIPFTLRMGFTSLHAIATLDSTAPGVSDLIGALTTISKTVTKMADELAQIDANEKALADAAKQTLDLVNKMQTDLANALAGTTLPPAVQAQVDTILAESNANLQAVKDLVTAATEPTPPPPAVTTT